MASAQENPQNQQGQQQTQYSDFKFENRPSTNGFMFHTPKHTGISTKFSFGPKSKNSTQMALFFMDGIHTYNLSPANYTKIKRNLQQAQDIGKTALNVSLVSGDILEGNNQNEFLWKYAKMAILNVIDDPTKDIKERSRILLCQSVRKAKTIDSYESTGEFGVYVPVPTFLEAGKFLYVEHDNNNPIIEVDF